MSESNFFPTNGIRFKIIKSINNRTTPGKDNCKSGALGGISDIMQNKKYNIITFKTDEKLKFFTRFLNEAKDNCITCFQYANPPKTGISTVR